MSHQGPVGVCHSVAEAHWYMERFAFLERRCMETLAAWVWTTGNLDAKLEFGRHAHEDALHADLCAQRITELHSALPTYGWEPRPPGLGPLDRVFREVVAAPTLAGKLSGLYGALKPWLLDGYEEYLRGADPILEGPTMRLLEQVAQDERRHVAWGQALLASTLAAEPAAHAAAARWQAYVESLLRDAATPVPAAETGAADLTRPLLRIEGERSVADPRMRIVYYSPRHGPSAEVAFDPQSEAEIQQIMLVSFIANETEAAELLCRVLVEFPELPWAMRVQLSRQMWDECRHAAAQWRILDGLGGDLGAYPAIAVINSFVGEEPDPLKRLIVLQRVVEGIALDQHRPRAVFFRRQGMDPLVRMFDYVLADEDGHIALSRWITTLTRDDPAHQRDVEVYQARQEQEYADYVDWVMTKRRDLARASTPPTAVPASSGGIDR